MTKKTPSIRLHLLEHSATKNDWVAIKAPRRGGRNGEWHFMKAERFHEKKQLAHLIAQKSLEVGELNPEQIISMLPEEVGTLSEQPGWAGDTGNERFVLFKHIIDNDPKRCHFYSKPIEARGLGMVSGTLEDWQENVAQVALASYPATICLLASLASPLLPLSKASEGAVINLVAKSSSGKTSSNKAAYSVWGNPKNLPSWGGTMSAIIQTASAHNQLICPLDDGELADLDPVKRNMKLHSYSHHLADGVPPQYSKTVRDEHESQPFDCFILSSNPESIEQDPKVNKIRTNGDRARFLEISAPSGEEGGIWAVGPALETNRRGTKRNCAQRSKNMVDAAEQNYGVAGKAWVAWLEAHYSELEGRINKLSSVFLKNEFPAMGGTHLRIAEKFALMYAAGILAIEADVLPTIGFARGRQRVKKACVFAINEVIQMAFPNTLIYNRAKDVLVDWLEDTEIIPEYDSRKNVGLKGKEISYGIYAEDEDRYYVKLCALDELFEERFGQKQATKPNIRSFLNELADRKCLRKSGKGEFAKDVRIGVSGEKIKLVEICIDEN
jgi:hypothetical protein